MLGGVMNHASCHQEGWEMLGHASSGIPIAYFAPWAALPVLMEVTKKNWLGNSVWRHPFIIAYHPARCFALHCVPHFLLCCNK